MSVIASDSEGNIDYTLKLGKKFIGQIYNCEISFENYKYSAQILVLDSNAVKSCVEKVNAADRAEIEELLKSEIKSVGLDDGKVKDYTYMAELIYTMRPQNGYTNNDFINAYKISEGLAEINKKLITLEEFLSKYSIYLDDDYAGLFSALDSDVKKDMENLFTNRLDAEASFKEMFETGIEFTGYRLAKTAIKLKEWFMGFAEKNNVSMTKYDSLNNAYKQEKVFEAMFKTRSLVYTKRMIADVFNTAVDEIYTDTSKDTGGGGGGGGAGGGSSKKSSGGFSALTEPITTPAPAYETNTAVSESLSDISGHWAEKSIKVLADKKILNGYTDKTFRPDEDITRAEFAKVLFSALGMKEKSENGFIDVTENDWYFGAVSALADIGIVVGADGYFMPQKNISRQDIAVMVQRLFDYMNLTPEKSRQVSYKDAEDITDYALSAVNNLTEIGLLNGSDGCFYPHKNATRAETAEIIYKVIGLMGLN